MNRPDEEEMPVLFDYLNQPITEAPRECTPEEVADLISRHDAMLRAPDPCTVDPQLVIPSGHRGHSDAIAWLLSPLDPPHGKNAPRRVVAALCCPGHIPGDPLADSLAIGRQVTARVFLDAEEDGKLWGEEPLFPGATQ